MFVCHDNFFANDNIAMLPHMNKTGPNMPLVLETFENRNVMQ